MQVVGSLAAGQAEHAMGILVDGPVTAATAPVDTAITAVLAGMSRRQLYEILSQARPDPVLRPEAPIHPERVETVQGARFLQIKFAAMPVADSTPAVCLQTF